MSSNYHLGNPLSGVKILDVGCGGGLLSEVRNSVLPFLLLKAYKVFALLYYYTAYFVIL